MRLAGGETPLRRSERALAASAVKHDPARTVVRQCRGIECRERIEKRSGDPLRRVLFRLPNVYQQQLAGMQEARYFGGIQGLDRRYMLRHGRAPFFLPPRRAGAEGGLQNSRYSSFASDFTSGARSWYSTERPSRRRPINPSAWRMAACCDSAGARKRARRANLLAESSPSISAHT